MAVINLIELDYLGFIKQQGTNKTIFLFCLVTQENPCKCSISHGRHFLQEFSLRFSRAISRAFSQAFLWTFSRAFSRPFSRVLLRAFLRAFPWAFFTGFFAVVFENFRAHFCTYFHSGVNIHFVGILWTFSSAFRWHFHERFYVIWTGVLCVCFEGKLCQRKRSFNGKF